MIDKTRWYVTHCRQRWCKHPTPGLQIAARSEWHGKRIQRTEAGGDGPGSCRGAKIGSEADRSILDERVCPVSDVTCLQPPITSTSAVPATHALRVGASEPKNTIEWGPECVFGLWRRATPPDYTVPNVNFNSLSSFKRSIKLVIFCGFRKRFNLYVHSAFLRGGCCFPPCVANVGVCMTARFDCNCNRTEIRLLAAAEIQ